MTTESQQFRFGVEQLPPHCNVPLPYGSYPEEIMTTQDVDKVF
jgi:hypothetical protein